MQLGVTVALCCHNSVKELGGTLKHLANQKAPDDLLWEVLLVDNCSTDGTAAFAEQTWKELGSRIPLRIVLEPQLGLSHARKTSFLESTYEYILIMDDDVWLEENYVRIGFDKMFRTTQAGVFCGWGEPKFEVNQLPDWVTPDFEFSCPSKPPMDRRVAYCATVLMGAFTRKSIWTKLYEVGFSTMQEGRKGSSMGGGEDLEMTCMITLLGYEIWESPQLYFKHFIPEERLSKEHLKKMSVGNGKVKTYILPYYWLCNSNLGFMRNNLLIQMGVSILNSSRKPFSNKYYDRMKKVEYQVHLKTIPDLFFCYHKITKRILQYKKNYQKATAKKSFRISQ